jgi:NTP pyrophosphatase (non-canonical NTP hydrolase)
MSLNAIKKKLLDFREERDWSQFHDPKNLAEAISIESAELLELFLWKNKDEVSNKIKNDPNYLQDIKDELADVLIYCIQMTNSLDLDVEQVIFDKLKKVSQKYPVDKSKGNAIKYNKL